MSEETEEADLLKRVKAAALGVTEFHETEQREAKPAEHLQTERVGANINLHSVGHTESKAETKLEAKPEEADLLKRVKAAALGVTKLHETEQKEAKPAEHLQKERVGANINLHSDGHTESKAETKLEP